MQNPSDGVPIGSGTFATILGGITIWNPWSNENYANLEDSACTVRVLLFFSMKAKAASSSATMTLTILTLLSISAKIKHNITWMKQSFR